MGLRCGDGGDGEQFDVFQRHGGITGETLVFRGHLSGTILEAPGRVRQDGVVVAGDLPDEVSGGLGHRFGRGKTPAHPRGTGRLMSNQTNIRVLVKLGGLG